MFRQELDEESSSDEDDSEEGERYSDEDEGEQEAEEEEIEFLTLPEFAERCWEGFENPSTAVPTSAAYEKIGIDLHSTSTEFVSSVRGGLRPVLHYDHDGFTAIGHLESFAEIFRTRSIQLTLEDSHESSRFGRVSQRSTFQFSFEGEIHKAKHCTKIRIGFVDLPSVGGRAELSLLFTESTRGLEEHLKTLLSSALLYDCHCTDNPRSTCKASLWRQLKASRSMKRGAISLPRSLYACLGQRLRRVLNQQPLEGLAQASFVFLEIYGNKFDLGGVDGDGVLGFAENLGQELDLELLDMDADVACSMHFEARSRRALVPDHIVCFTKTGINKINLLLADRDTGLSKYHLFNLGGVVNGQADFRRPAVDGNGAEAIEAASLRIGEDRFDVLGAKCYTQAKNAYHGSLQKSQLRDLNVMSAVSNALKASKTSKVFFDKLAKKKGQYLKAVAAIDGVLSRDWTAQRTYSARVELTVKVDEVSHACRFLNYLFNELLELESDHTEPDILILSTVGVFQHLRLNLRLTSLHVASQLDLIQAAHTMRQVDARWIMDAFTSMSILSTALFPWTFTGVAQGPDQSWIFNQARHPVADGVVDPRPFTMNGFRALRRYGRMVWAFFDANQVQVLSFDRELGIFPFSRLHFAEDDRPITSAQFLEDAVRYCVWKPSPSEWIADIIVTLNTSRLFHLDPRNFIEYGARVVFEAYQQYLAGLIQIKARVPVSRIDYRMPLTQEAVEEWLGVDSVRTADINEDCYEIWMQMLTPNEQTPLITKTPFYIIWNKFFDGVIDHVKGWMGLPRMDDATQQRWKAYLINQIVRICREERVEVLAPVASGTAEWWDVESFVLPSSMDARTRVPRPAFLSANTDPGPERIREVLEDDELINRPNGRTGRGGTS